MFWTDYLFLSESGEQYSEFDGLQLRFDVSSRFGLTLDFNQALSGVTLSLHHPEADEPVQIAWDDQAHWHPHVLRWDELDAVCRVVSKREPYLGNPYLPYLLLYRFAPITVGDDANAIFRVLEQAWRSLNLLPEANISTLTTRFDYRRAGFVWKSVEPLGWMIQQDQALRQMTGTMANADLYSLRRRDNPAFPHSQFNRLVKTAERGLPQQPDLD
jgi:hypothetical protein